MKPLFYFLQYLKKLYIFAPQRFLLGCSLMVVDSFLAGFGLLLLIPILHYAGWLPITLYQDDSWIFKVMRFLPTPHGHFSLLFTLLIFVILITIISAISYWQQQVMNQLRQNYLAFLTQQLNHAIANVKWSFLLKNKSKHLEQLINTGLPQISALTYHSLQIISNSIVILIFTLFSLFISFYLTLIVCIIALILATLSSRWNFFASGKRIFEAYRKQQEQLGKFLDGIKMAKSYNQIDAYLDYFDQLNRNCRQLQLEFIKNSSLMSFIYRVFSAIAIAIIFFTGILFFKLNIVTLILLLLIFARLLPKISSWQQDYISSLGITPVFQQAQLLLNEFNKEQDILIKTGEISFAKHIELVNLSFSYQQNTILKNISAQLTYNTTTAIVGASGSGKSTLADLLLGLLSPSTGQIFIDDEPLTADNVYLWRKLLSYVPQDAYFFNDTIRANLLWAAPHASEQELWQTLTLTAAKAFVQNLPDGLDTMMGDRGVYFSGGEKQRLALARALLRKPKVLILDEATSALDSQNETLIYQTLQNLHGKMTIIIITHRYSTIRNADSVIVLSEGEIVETDKPEILLMQNNSVFAKLFKTQID